MDKLIITAACDSSVSYPSNPNCPAPTRENTGVIAEEYVRCIDAGAAISHLHGVRKLESELQADGRKLSRLDIDGWREITDGIRAERDTIIQYGIAGARFEDRVPLLDLGAEMMSVAFNAHDEHFQPDPDYPPNCIYSLHPIDELRDYARELPRHGVKPEIEVFHSGAVWNLGKLHSEDLLTEPLWATLFLDWEGGSWTPPTEAALLYMTDLLPDFVNYNVSVMSPTTQWKLLSMVIGLGGHVRVGAEDNPYLSPGELADTNARLVEKIVRIADGQGRDIATPAEAREIIGLDPR
ncbi:MAG: 3-keto-5-aminohexanoate cleavage protein [Acidimicrobiia bacterium]